MKCKSKQICFRLIDTNKSIYSKAQAVQGMLAFAIFVTHALACYVAIDIAWNEYLVKRFTNNNSFWEYTTRTLLVFVTCEKKQFLLNRDKVIN